MLCPVISARIKEPYQLTGWPIDRPEITSFVSIARLAGVGKIDNFCCATVLDADYVIHFAAKEGICDINLCGSDSSKLASAFSEMVLSLL